MNPNIEDQLRSILGQYRDSFITKEYREENNDHDVLMDVFGITPDLKRETSQMLSSEQNPEVCDATDADSSNAAGSKRIMNTE